MSMEQSNAKNSKGKQKIEIKKVENEDARMVSFSKRKGGIYKKMVEFITKSNGHGAFLTFSETGRPYTFAHPSIEEVADRVRNPQRQEPDQRDNTRPLVEAYEKQRIEEIIETYETFVEKLGMENETLKVVKESRKGIEGQNMWWNNLENLGLGDLMQRQQVLVELHDKVFKRLEKGTGASSSGHAGQGQSGGGGGVA